MRVDRNRIHSKGRQRAKLETRIIAYLARLKDTHLISDLRSEQKQSGRKRTPVNPAEKTGLHGKKSWEGFRNVNQAIGEVKKKPNKVYLYKSANGFFLSMLI